MSIARWLAMAGLGLAMIAAEAHAQTKRTPTPYRESFFHLRGEQFDAQRDERWDDAIRLVIRQLEIGVPGDEVFLHIPRERATSEQRARIDALAARHIEPVEASRQITAVPLELGGIASLAWDAKSDTLYAGSIGWHGILARKGEGKWRRIPLPFVPGVVRHMGVDAARRLLWFSTSGLTGEPKGAVRGLFAIDLRGGRIVRRIPLAFKYGPELMTVAGDGTVFISGFPTGFGMVVPGGRKLIALTEPKLPGSMIALAATPDATRVYFTTQHEGLFLFDVATQTFRRVPAQIPAMFDAIEQLLYRAGALYAVQKYSGFGWRRIVRLTLTAEGDAVSNLDVIERKHSTWRKWGPGGLAMRGDMLMYPPQIYHDPGDPAAAIRAVPIG